MDNAKRVAVIYSTEELAHVVGSLALIKVLVALLCDPVKKMIAPDELHDQVCILAVVVGLIVLYDVWVVETADDGDLVHNAVSMTFKFIFVKHLDGDLHRGVVFVGRLEDFAKGALAKNKCLCIYKVVGLEFAHALLLAAFALHNCKLLLLFYRCDTAHFVLMISF